MPAGPTANGDRRRMFRRRKMVAAALIGLFTGIAAVLGWGYGGASGAASVLSSAAAMGSALSYRLRRHTRRARRRPPAPPPVRSLPAPALPAPLPGPPPQAEQVSRAGAGSGAVPTTDRAHRKDGRFPQPVHTSARADEVPWHLPAEPGPAAIAADTALIGGLELRAASIVGPGHRCETGAPRQDAYRLATDESGRYLIVAIADGMADSSHSHVGASVATTAIVQYLRPLLGKNPPDPGPPTEWFIAGARQMIAAAAQRNLDPDAVRAAALVVIVEIFPDADLRRQVWMASIADVSAWHLRNRSWCQVAGDPKTGMDASRLTHFLPYHPREVRSSRLMLGANDVLALTTDGIGDVLAGGPIAAWFAERWATPPHISDFIDIVGFEAKGELDDRTAVVLWCPPASAMAQARRP